MERGRAAPQRPRHSLPSPCQRRYPPRIHHRTREATLFFSYTCVLSRIYTCPPWATRSKNNCGWHKLAPLHGAMGKGVWRLGGTLCRFRSRFSCGERRLCPKIDLNSHILITWQVIKAVLRLIREGVYSSQAAVGLGFL